MKSGFRALVVWCLVSVALAPSAMAQTPPDAVYVIFDASGSMWGQLPDKSHKVVVAKEVLQDFVAQDFGEAELALRAYGHRRKGDCRDSELVIPFGPSEAVAGQVRDFMKTLNPLGKTPITYSLRQALADFGEREGAIILITDGLETCDEDPCALMREWREKGVKVDVHVVGFGLVEQEKETLQCISDAAGTPYRDAGSALELAQGLAEIHRATVPEPTGEPGEPPENRSVGFWLQGFDPDGAPIRVEGRLMRDGEARYEVSSQRRNRVDAGTYELVAGVRTANGALYRPVTLTVATGDEADTVVRVDVPEPPSVRAKFTDADEAQRGALIHAYREGREVFTFRWMDEVYVDEGTYTFRTRPNADNDLSLTETLSAGDHKELVFEMVHTVRAVVRMIAEGTGEVLRGNYELWQDGARAYKVHMRNGADVRPGVYDVHLVNDLIPHVAPGVVVAAGGDQEIEIVVPVGYVTFIYEKADGTRDADKRVFLGRGPDEKGRVYASGKAIPLIPGVYNVVGWRGAYDPVVFEVAAGDEREIALRNKE